MSIFLKWLGHAGFQIAIDSKIVYVDPFEGECREKADIVLVSHSHYDHCDPSKLEKILRPDTVVIAPSECASKIRANIKTLEAGGKTNIGNIRIEAVPAYNVRRFRSPGNPFHPKGFGVGYLITIDDKTIYHAGDTDFIPEMNQLKNVYLALIPTGGTYTMDNAEAVEATLAINPKIAIPMHRWNTNPEEFKKKVEKTSRIQVVILKPGETREF